ncbi:DEKNAAC105607 [Brettanomyces naardenensis]|uniref:Signal peptidase complex subunit 2 n=1 Tax=Brettanomyces naardenensis TaxID=13370 RepID=A0A448YTW6_BRENA|nr:DEKNAAC105607 [Brettanomyces naardenensis]
MGKKVNLNSAVALRNESDEHLAPALTKLGYTESFRLVDAKLIIGYSCVLFAGLMYYCEKKFKNDFGNAEYVKYTEILVVLFFLSEFVWYIFGKFVEKSIKYVGTKGAKSLKVSSHLKSKTDPVYYLEVDLDGIVDEEQIEFTKLFNEDGFLDFAVFAKYIAEAVQKLEKEK